MIYLLCTHRGTLQCHTHNALLTLYSPWHSAVSHPQCFAYSVLAVALCIVTATMLCLLCAHRGTLQYHTHNALHARQEDSLGTSLCWRTGAEPSSMLVLHAE